MKRIFALFFVMFLTSVFLIAQEIEPAPSANAYHIQPSIDVNPKDFNNIVAVSNYFLVGALNNTSVAYLYSSDG